MHKIKSLSISLLIILFCTLSTRAQVNTQISFSVLDLSTLPLQSLLNFSTANLQDIQTQAGVFIIATINSQQQKVVLNGRLDWQSPDGSFSGPVFAFSSEHITLNQGGGFYPYSLTFNNQDVGDGNNVDVAESDDYGGTAIEKIAKLGRLSGIVDFYLWCTDPLTGAIISNEAYQQQVFANEVPNFTINSPSTDVTVNQDGFTVAWNPTINSAEKYLIVINENSFDSKEDAVSGEPNLNKEFDNVNGNLTYVSLNPADFNRDLVEGTTYHIGVFAKIPSLSAGGYDYFSADNSNLQFTVGTDGQVPDNFGTDAILSFNIISPLPRSEFSIVFGSPSLFIEWEAVNGVSNYRLDVNYLGSNLDLLTQARSDNDNKIIPGQRIISTSVSGNSYTLSSLPSTQTFNNGDYIVIGVYANHPSYGNTRSRQLLIGKIIKTTTEVTTIILGPNDVEELLNNSDLDNAVGVDSNGQTVSGDDLKDLLEQIKNGSLQGRVTIIQ